MFLRNSASFNIDTFSIYYSWYLSRSEKASNPFKKIKTSNLKSSLHDWAKTHKFTLDKHSPSMQKRNKAAVCKTFQQVGIVVPYDKKTEVGYRPLSENTSKYKCVRVFLLTLA